MTLTEQSRLGQWGETRAEDFLLSHGLQLLQRNYRCRAGEIDLIMLHPDDCDGRVVVFVEVRLRAVGAMVEALETVDARKQRKLIQAAQHFLMQHPEYAESACRFDVVAIDDPQARPVWVRGAFETS
jgi:putative endonuclease